MPHGRILNSILVDITTILMTDCQGSRLELVQRATYSKVSLGKQADTIASLEYWRSSQRHIENEQILTNSDEINCEINC